MRGLEPGRYLQARLFQYSLRTQKKFREALKSIRKLTVAPPDDLGEKMQMLCREAGVELLFVREIPKSGICGAAYWINDTPCIQMSLRYKKNDHFWFTFFHEAAHILCEHKKNGVP